MIALYIYIYRAALSDDQGRDADAPKLSEAERHSGGYDTQYGMTDRLGSKVIEQTPEGDVVTNLVTRKYARAFPSSHELEDADDSHKSSKKMHGIKYYKSMVALRGT